MSTIREQLYMEQSPFPPNKRRRKVTPAQRQEIQYRRREGESLRTLALEYGLTVGYVRNDFPAVERPLD